MIDKNPTNIVLPTNFLFGAASSAHQVEGNNINNDWWHWEQLGKLPISGKSCDHYHRYEEDFTLARDLGLNAMRISIEWGRIQPKPGVWDWRAISHYHDVLLSMKARGLSPIVTLHHFTLPWWIAAKGGFENKTNIQAFIDFATKMVTEFGSQVDLWCTINEPIVYALLAYQRGLFPPFKKSSIAMWEVVHNLIRAHKETYYAIKKIRPNAQIGLVKNNVYYESYRKYHPLDILLVRTIKYFGNHYVLDKIKHEIDFIGLNYYFYRSLSFGVFGYKIMNNQGAQSDMGWPIYPKGLYYLLKDLSKYHKPIYITENGVANARDDVRKDYIAQHLLWISQAVADGVDVRGYFYWSLTDTYEWYDGFSPKFGLVEVDFETQKRTLRPSAAVFKEIQQT